MGDHELAGILPGDDAGFFARRVPHTPPGRAVKLRLSALALLTMMWAGPAMAQSCAMCYSTARAVTKEGQRAITRGVVVLLLPPVGFMTVGVGLALRYGKKRDEEQN